MGRTTVGGDRRDTSARSGRLTASGTPQWIGALYLSVLKEKKTLSRPVPGTFGGKSLLTRKRGSDGTQSLRIHSSSSYCTRWMPSFWLAWKPPGAARSRLLPPDLDHVLTALARAGAWHCAGRRHPNRALHISSYTWATFFFPSRWSIPSIPAPVLSRGIAAKLTAAPSPPIVPGLASKSRASIRETQNPCFASQLLTSFARWPCLFVSYISHGLSKRTEDI